MKAKNAILVTSLSVALASPLAFANEVNKFGRSDHSWNFRSPVERIAAERLFRLRCDFDGRGCNSTRVESLARELGGTRSLSRVNGSNASSGSGGSGSGAPGLQSGNAVGNQINVIVQGDGNTVTVEGNTQSNTDSTIGVDQNVSDNDVDITETILNGGNVVNEGNSGGNTARTVFIDSTGVPHLGHGPNGVSHNVE